MRLSSGLGAFAASFGLATAATNATINSQVRLAYAGDSGMYVSWNTFSQLSHPTVKYGLSALHLNSTASSNVSVTYRTSLTYNNHVKITDLVPDTTYYYLPEEMIKANSSTAPYTFKTSRVIGDGTPYSIAVVVDMGTMGAQGLTTSAGKVVSANNILAVNETNTIESLTSAIDEFEFLWHRKYASLAPNPKLIMILYSWRHCICRLLAQRGDPRIPPKHHHCRRI